MVWFSLSAVGLLLPLVLTLMVSAEARQEGPQTLQRKKRDWILPPTKLMENTDYTNKEYIAKIRSDKDRDTKVEYYLSGPGADKLPFNLFVVDHDTGFVRITGILDREKQPFYNLTGIAKYSDGSAAEDAIPLTIAVLDQNDNPPYFELHTGNISEASKEGTFVMQIKGKDDDQDGTINSDISYSIISQEPKGAGQMFTIDKKTGKLYVKEPTLDRETYDFYKLIIKGTDMGGATGGLTGTGTVEIKVLDINDNIPTLEKSAYSGSVDENVADVIVLRIKALDKDLIHTDNWLTVFTITKGNEDNLFSIETDKKTNEGILKLIKPVDFEEVQNLELGLIIENVAPLVEGGAVLMDVNLQVGEGDPLATGTGFGTGVGAAVGAGVELGVDAGVDAGVNAGVNVGVDADLEAGVDVGGKPNVGLKPGVKPGVKPGAGPGVGVGIKSDVRPGPGKKPKPYAPPKSYPIKIAVNNMPEGPTFIPDTKKIPVSEDPKETPEDGVIAVFAATDPDTGKPAEDVSYAKAYDPGNWFTIDEETAEVKLNRAPDRESPFLVNGTYIAKIFAITKGMPSKTATGTIAIQVTDVNDHCPTLTTTHSSLCSDQKTVYITGFDEDVSPNAAPFTFRMVPEGSRGSWDIEIINDTSAALHSREELWPSLYELQVEVLDAQGLSCPTSETFTVHVCTCVESTDCSLNMAKLGTTSTSELSAPAIGMLLMAMCLLLLIPLLLLFCHCGGADTIFPDQFSDLPFDTKEHLISYHTEGKGDDKEVPLQRIPVGMGAQKKTEMAPAHNFNSIPSNITEIQKATFYNDSVHKFQETSQSLMEVDNPYRFSRESFNYGNSGTTFRRQTFGVSKKSALYEDIALPDTFLIDYYSQKAQCAVPTKDGVLEYEYEGEGSPAGSVGCCSLLESDNDLQFLNDLGVKFKTLAEVWSPPTPKPSPQCKFIGAVQTTADVAEPVVKPKTDSIDETKHANIKTKNVMSSTNISKSSLSTVSSAQQSVTLPHSKATNISHCAIISHSATLPHPIQNAVLQQPIYYTTTPVVQPLHYVVQPQLQKTVLLTNETHGANYSGLYVVSGPQGSPAGLVIPKISAGSTSPVSSTLFLHRAPGLAQGSVPVEGKLTGPDFDRDYTLLEEKSSPGEAEGVDPGSPRGTLPSGDILAKEAAPPQGVLDLAAQGSVYGILPGHTVKKGAINRNLGQTWVGKPGQIGLGPVTVLEVGIGQSTIGMEQMEVVKPKVKLAETLPAGIGTVASKCKQVSVNQFQGMPPPKQAIDTNGIPSTGSLNSSKKQKTDNVVNTLIKAEATKPRLHSKEVGMVKNRFKNNSDQAQKMLVNTAEKKPSKDMITYVSELDTTLDVLCEVVKGAFEDNESMKEYTTQTSKSSVLNREDAIEKSLARPHVLHKSFEQSDTLKEKAGGRVEEHFFCQLNKTNDTLTNKSGDVRIRFNRTNSSDPQENIEETMALETEQKGTYIPSAGFPEEDITMVTQMSSIEVSLLESQVNDLINANKAMEKTKSDQEHQEGKPNSSLDHIDIVDDQMHGITEESMGRQEEEALKEERPIQPSIVEGPEDKKCEVGSEPLSDMIIEYQSKREHMEDVSPTEEVLSDLKTNQNISISDCTQTNENLSKLTMVPAGDVHEEVKAEQEKRFDSEVGLITADDELSPIPSDEISKDTMNESDERSVPNRDSMPDLRVIQENEDKCHAKTDIGNDASLKTVSTSLIGQQERHKGEPNLTAMEDQDNQQNMSGPGQDLNNVNADTDSISDRETEEISFEKAGSRQSLTTSDDQNEDSERQDALSTNVPVQHNIGCLGDQNEERTKDDSSHTSSPVDDLLYLDDKEDKIVEKAPAPVQENLIIVDEQDDDIASEDTSEKVLLLEHQVTADENINTDEKKQHTVEEVTLSIHLQCSIPSDQIEENEREDAGSVISEVEDHSISGDNISDHENEDCMMEERVSRVQQKTSILGEEEDINVAQTISHVEDESISADSNRENGEDILEEDTLSIQSHCSISNDRDEETEREEAGGMIYEMEDQSISEDNVSDFAKEEDVVEEGLSPVPPTHVSYTVLPVKGKLISDDTVSDGENLDEIVMSNLQQNLSLPEEENATEMTSGTGARIEEEGIQSYHLLQEDSQSLERECLYEEDFHLTSQPADGGNVTGERN